jgi:hypothetical protein
MSEPVEVHVPVEPNDSGYPPLKEERLWCIPQDSGTYLVDNIPFYATDISLGDEIRAAKQNGELWFQAIVNPSKNTTVHVFARRESFGPVIIPRMRSFGGLTEKMEGSDLVAVSFPPTADLAGALAFLDKESAAGNLAFEESAVRYRTGASRADGAPLTR